MKILIKEIKRALYKADLALRPKIVFMNPLDAKTIKDAFPEIEKTIVIQETEALESGMSVVMNRKDLEKWANNGFDYTWSELE